MVTPTELVHDENGHQPLTAPWRELHPSVLAGADQGGVWSTCRVGPYPVGATGRQVYKCRSEAWRGVCRQVGADRSPLSFVL
jgi:hypothetical protein